MSKCQRWYSIRETDNLIKETRSFIQSPLVRRPGRYNFKRSMMHWRLGVDIVLSNFWSPMHGLLLIDGFIAFHIVWKEALHVYFLYLTWKTKKITKKKTEQKDMIRCFNHAQPNYYLLKRNNCPNWNTTTTTTSHL